MAIGERIRFIRNLKGLTQRQLGVLAGFKEESADIRISQYESGLREPKEEFVNKIAESLNVSPSALDTPAVNTVNGAMHTLFILEDLYGFEITRVNNQVCLNLGTIKDGKALSLFKQLIEWEKQAEKFRDSKISREEYDSWRYTYNK